MLPENIELEVVTPERHVLQETVKSVEIPGKEGYLGVLPGHAPLITELGIGILTYRNDSETRYLTVIDGYAEVLPDRVIVLAELSERAEEIDVARTRAALDRAKAEVAKTDARDPEWERATWLCNERWSACRRPRRPAQQARTNRPSYQWRRGSAESRRSPRIQMDALRLCEEIAEMAANHYLQHAVVWRLPAGQAVPARARRCRSEK